MARLFGLGPRGALVFLAFYLTCGVIAGLGFVLADLRDVEPVVGASGAISGLLGAASRIIQGHGRIGPIFGSDRHRHGDRLGDRERRAGHLRADAGRDGHAGGLAGAPGRLRRRRAADRPVRAAGRARSRTTSRNSALHLRRQRAESRVSEWKQEDRAMLVSQILKGKGDLVFTASPTDSVAAVAALLRRAPGRRDGGAGREPRRGRHRLRTRHRPRRGRARRGRARPADLRLHDQGRGVRRARTRPSTS